MITRLTTPEESRRVDELFSIAFELPMEDGPAEEESPRVHHWAAFQDDDKTMMSTFTITDFIQNFDNHGCKMGGMGGVATLPQYRRQGGVRSCFEKALPWMYDQGYELSYLYPFSTAYYRRFGYENCVQRYQTTVNLGLLQPAPVEGSFRLCEPSDPQVEAVQLVDRAREHYYNMMVRHEPEDYDWVRKADPAQTREYTYVYYDKLGEARSYTTFRMEMQPDGRNLQCSRFAFLDREGWDGLMHLFKSLAADHALVKFQIPANAALRSLCPEWSMGAAQWSVAPAGMVRVVNVREILRKAFYRGSGRVCLEIRDPQIRQNNGVFAVTFEQGRAVCVEETAEAPDAVLEISTFSALMAGVADFAEADYWMPGIKVLGNRRTLAQVFYGKPLMICDYF